MSRPPSTFDRYYDEFLRNATVRDSWQIELTSGRVLEGIPSTGMYVDFADPQFIFFDGVRTYRVSFSKLVTGSPLPNLG